MSTNSDYRLKFLEAKKLSRFNNSDLMGVLVIAALVIGCVSLVTQILLFFSVSAIAKKPVPTLVQLPTGDTVTVAPLGSLERTPEVITKFTSKALSMLMSWSGTVASDGDGAKPIADPGVEIKGDGLRQKVTTPTYQAAFALSEDFRKEFLLELAKLTPSGVFNDTAKVVFVPLEIQKPIQIETGKWKVKVVANLMVFDQSDVAGKAISFNKEVFLKAVEIPEFQPNLSGIALAVQQMRSSGLEIYAIRDLPKEDIK